MPSFLVTESTWAESNVSDSLPTAVLVNVSSVAQNCFKAGGIEFITSTAPSLKNCVNSVCVGALLPSIDKLVSPSTCASNVAIN